MSEKQEKKINMPIEVVSFMFKQGFLSNEGIKWYTQNLEKIVVQNKRPTSDSKPINVQETIDGENNEK